MRPGKIQAVIFDFNGTLFFDSDKHEDAWIEYSKRVRPRPFDKKEMQHLVHGRTNRAIHEYLLQRSVSDPELRQCIHEKERIYQDLCLNDPNSMNLVEGAIEFFEFLESESIPYTIATASEIGNINFYREHLNLDKWFDLSKIVMDDGIIEGKPAPDMFLKACQILNADPKQCILFEDSLSGFQAARNANMGTIVMVDPAGSESRFHDFDEVDAIIPDFRDIKQILASIFS